MLDTLSSALEFKIVVKGVVRMKSALSVIERIREVRMGMADLIRQTGWRSAVQHRFNFVLLYGRLVLEAVLEGIWSEDVGEQVVIEVRFR